MFKKGSLSISTNAIVVLIIAVVMLGLIMGLVTRGFGLVERSFLEEISNEADPTPASPRTPITINKDQIFVSPGERLGFKYSVFNSDEDTLEGSGSNPLYPEITCVGEGGDTVIDTGDLVREPIVVDAGEAEQFEWIGRVLSTAEGDVYLCNLQVTGVSDRANFRINIE